MRHRAPTAWRSDDKSGAEVTNHATGPEASLLFYTGLVRAPLWLGVPHVEGISRYRFSIDAPPGAGLLAPQQLMRTDLRTSSVPVRHLDLQPGGFYQWCVEGSRRTSSPWSQLASGLFWMLDSDGLVAYDGIRTALTRAPDLEFAALAGSMLLSRIGLYNDSVALICRRTGEPVQAGRERLRHMALALVYKNMTANLQALCASGDHSRVIPPEFVAWSMARADRHRALAGGATTDLCTVSVPGESEIPERTMSS
ncbi:MAG: hypothetical protein KGJ62_08640 [Armatimonadetes bacterium]|nr:hypothetical protein [Armatimonadota bacterium]MDE2205040.1 hypothetical protein [Armatimonadota bacterium]